MDVINNVIANLGHQPALVVLFLLVGPVAGALVSFFFAARTLYLAKTSGARTDGAYAIYVWFYVIVGVLVLLTLLLILCLMYGQPA